MNTGNENWVGKKLVDKDNPKIQRTVVEQNNGTLILDNNGRIEESTSLKRRSGRTRGLCF